MTREKELYRDNLQLLKEKYPDKLTFTLNEAAALLGVDRRTLINDKNFHKPRSGRYYIIPVTAIAHYMS
jgi:hypothetical protein